MKAQRVQGDGDPGSQQQRGVSLLEDNVSWAAQATKKRKQRLRRVAGSGEAGASKRMATTSYARAIVAREARLFLALSAYSAFWIKKSIIGIIFNQHSQY